MEWWQSMLAKKRAEDRRRKMVSRDSDVRQHNPADWPPTPGFFKLREVRKGPFVGALIFIPCPIDPEFGLPMDRPRRLVALIDEREADIQRVWDFGIDISEWEYRFLIDDAAWVRKYGSPNDPKANPKQAIDLNAMQPLF